MFPGGVYRRVGGSRGPPRVTFGYFSSQKSNPSPGRRTVCHPAVTLRRRRRDKIITFCQQPLSQPAADSLSLRLGHGAALICHRHIIHYRAATSLPLTQGSLRGGENRERKGVCGDGSFCPEEYPAGAWRAVGRCFADRLCPRCRGGSDAGTFRLRAGHSAGGVPVFGGFGIPGGGARGRGDWRPSFPG